MQAVLKHRISRLPDFEGSFISGKRRTSIAPPQTTQCGGTPSLFYVLFSCVNNAP